MVWYPAVTKSYKSEQYQVEKGFRFLKDKTFRVSEGINNQILFPGLNMADGQTYFLLMLILLILSDFWFPYPMIISAPVTYFGIILLILGLWVIFWTRSLLLEQRTTLSPYETPTALVTSGPFSISRNPVYLGMTAILAGSAIFMGSGITFVFPILFILIIEMWFIPVEEQKLERVFGEQYLEYKKTVRKWV